MTRKSPSSLWVCSGYRIKRWIPIRYTLLLPGGMRATVEAVFKGDTDQIEGWDYAIPNTNLAADRRALKARFRSAAEAAEQAEADILAAAAHIQEILAKKRRPGWAEACRVPGTDLQ